MGFSYPVLGTLTNSVTGNLSLFLNSP